MLPDLEEGSNEDEERDDESGLSKFERDMLDMAAERQDRADLNRLAGDRSRRPEAAPFQPDEELESVSVVEEKQRQRKKTTAEKKNKDVSGRGSPSRKGGKELKSSKRSTAKKTDGASVVVSSPGSEVDGSSAKKRSQKKQMGSDEKKTKRVDIGRSGGGGKVGKGGSVGEKKRTGKEGEDTGEEAKIDSSGNESEESLPTSQRIPESRWPQGFSRKHVDSMTVDQVREFIDLEVEEKKLEKGEKKKKVLPGKCCTSSD